MTHPLTRRSILAGAAGALGALTLDAHASTLTDALSPWTDTSTDLGNKTNETTILTAVHTNLADGTPITVTMATGIGGHINVVNRKTGTLTWHGRAVTANDYERYSRGGAVIPGGDIIFSTGRTDLLVRFNPTTHAITTITNPYYTPAKSNDLIFDMVKATNGVLYLGVYHPITTDPSVGGLLYTYNPATGTWGTTGTIERGAAYARSVTAWGDHVYTGMGTGTGHTGIYAINIKTGVKTKLPAPPVDHADMVADISAGAGRLFARWTGDAPTYIFDIAKHAWTGTVTGLSAGILPNPGKPNEVLAYRGSNVIAYDVTTGAYRVTATGAHASLVSDTSAIATDTLATFTTQGDLITLGPGIATRLTNTGGNTLMVGSQRALTGIWTTANNNLLIGPSFVGSQVWQATPATNTATLAASTLKTTPTYAQVQTMCRTTNGNTMVATYSPGHFYTIGADLTKKAAPVAFDASLVKPIASREVEPNIVAVAVIGNYGKLGGGLCYYNTNTHTIDRYIRPGTVFERYCPWVLASDASYTYVGTNIDGGLGTTTPLTSALIAKVETATGRIVSTTTPLAGARAVNALLILGGTLYASVGNTLFIINPVTMKPISRVCPTAAPVPVAGGSIHTLVAVGTTGILHGFGGTIVHRPMTNLAAPVPVTTGSWPTIAADGSLFYLEGHRLKHRLKRGTPTRTPHL